MRAFSKLTEVVDGELRIASDPPVLVPLEQVFDGELAEVAEQRIRAVLDEYRETLSPDRRHLLDRYRYVHTARKVVGVGSVGTRAWIALFVGRDEGDPLFLQVKEAQTSVLEPYAAPTEYPHQGQRVVEGQRLTQSASDILLGWLTAAGPDDVKRDFYVRQLWDQKGSAVVEMMSPDGMDATPGSAARSWRAPTRARATRSRSPPTSAAAPAMDQAIARVRGRLRRPERARLRGARGRGRVRQGRGAGGRACVRARLNRPDGGRGAMTGALTLRSTRELKLTVPDAEQRSTVDALGLDPLDAQIRQVFFFDTPDLALNEAGVVVRARRIQGTGDDSVVKLRPVVPDELPERACAARPSSTVEVDAMPGGYVCSASLKASSAATRRRGAVGGERAAAQAVLEGAARVLRRACARGRRARRPRRARADLRAQAEVRRRRTSTARLVAELWIYPDSLMILELSTKCKPPDIVRVALETRALLAERGIDVSRRAADEDEDGAADLRPTAGQRVRASGVDHG